MAEVATSPPTPAHNRTRNWMKPGLQVGRNGKWGQMGEKWGKWRGMWRGCWEKFRSSKVEVDWENTCRERFSLYLD